jgi:hypothetical protein
MNKYEPIIKELATGLLENAEIKPNFSDNAFLDASLIFQSALMDKIYDLQIKDKMPMLEKEKMAIKCGKEFRKFIKIYTNLDTVELVNNYIK